ncbi:uncharacterized protein N7483_003792 [Penicillium malachiteum]|uniref:uncharacterized protein n=1 Tax=Penicillium malachiteum TaxID=1324776 RepID=UPI0025496F34|nr:uncharacterized protein N7483_003792 [Penicillium malachiteum]KAJ5729284.1 hypothetical protein N7483_003792 [Penicillium malachiteum]
MTMQPEFNFQLERSSSLSISSDSDSEASEFDFTYRYGREEAYGANWQRWQTDVQDKSCPVQKARITIRMLRLYFDGWATVTKPELVPPPPQIQAVVRAYNLSDDRNYKQVVIQQSHGTFWINDYYLLTGPGVVFSLNCHREDGPHWSEIVSAAYRHYQTTGVDLRYVFRVNVVNPTTLLLISRLYRANGLAWPHSKRVRWKYDTPEYQAILSTPNGRGVAALAIGGFKRGTRYISEIITWTSSSSGHEFHMLFVISKWRS